MRHVRFVRCEITGKGEFRRHAWLLQFNNHERQAIHEPDDVGPARVQRSGDDELIHQQEIIRLRMFPVNDGYSFRFPPAVFAVEHLDGYSSLQQLIDIYTGCHCRHRRPVAQKFIYGKLNSFGRDAWIQLL